ncbi:MAG TPA: hypothetical protein VFE93_08760, partial [Myxococcaceae bacterium]|nr:hypothetical protein [Myxococcaceae bacterium]
PANGAIPSGSSGDLASILKSGGAVMDNLVATSASVRKLTESFDQPGLAKDLTGIISSTKSILQNIERGSGALHALVYDPAGGPEVHRLLVKAADVSTQAERALEQVAMILEGARTGDGAIHALLYDPKAAKAVGQLSDAAGEIATLLHDARTTENGAIHQLVYGDAHNLFENLGAMSEDLRAISGKIRAGEGTLGALVVDPSVYDDLRTVLGNVKRNKVLQELVRITVSSKGGVEHAGRPPDGKPMTKVSPAPASPPAPTGARPRPAQEADRRPRAVRRLRDRAPADRRPRGVRVRRQDRRRRHPTELPARRGQGDPGGDAARRARGGARAGHPRRARRRPVPQRRLVGDGVQDRRPDGVQEGCRARQAGAARA